MKRFLLFLCIAIHCWGTDCDCISGILILNGWNEVRKSPVDEVSGVVADGVPLLEKNPSFLRELNYQFVGKPLDRDTIELIKEEIANFYQSKGNVFAVVSVPAQDFSKCVVQIVVDESRLGEVRTRGNCYFPSSWLKGAIRTKSGSTINTKQVLEDVAWLNLNPFRRTDAILTPGKAPGTTDIELVTIDRWPYRVYMGGDNTGTVPTDRNRLFFGFNFGKTALKDGQISYQFTCSPNWNRFYAHTASARLPLPWRDVIVFYGGYSHVEPTLNVHGYKEKAISWQVDGRYRIPLFFSSSVLQEFVIGYDFKETNYNIYQNRTNVSHATADISQVMLGYELGARGHKQRVSFVLEAYISPGRITTDGKSEDFRKFRYKAGPVYGYLKAAHSFAREVGRWWLTYDITGQASTKNLLLSEQFTMTGYNAVRGFEERILNLDNAIIASAAIETPHWHPAKHFRFKKCWDELYFLLFFDSGYGCNHRAAPGEKKYKSLGSIGPGFRYQIDRFFTARFDYGYQLWHSGFPNPSDSRYNFGLILSY